MDEQHRAARAADIMGAKPPAAREPFDPAGLLEGRRPPPPPVATAATVAVREPFDPATFLGERALRGAFDLSTVKPLRMTVDGVEMVTVPADAYADALRRIAGQEKPAEAAEQAGPTPDAAGMLDLLLATWAGAPIEKADLLRVTGLDETTFDGRIAARTASAVVVTPPATEAHRAALDDGRETEAHGAALDPGKPKSHPRKAGTVREIP